MTQRLNRHRNTSNVSSTNTVLKGRAYNFQTHNVGEASRKAKKSGGNGRRAGKTADEITHRHVCALSYDSQACALSHDT